VSFFSHRETRTASEVALAMYFVFLVSSSAAETGLDIAATTADAEFVEFAEEAAVEVAVVEVDDLRLFILTGVQS
jgi:hypothetical protein